jgi:hypothetical protein
MFKKRAIVLLGTALLAILAATPLLAATQARPAAQDVPTPQGDPAADTTRATVDMRAGFILDPYLLPVIGAGDVAASEALEGCNGFVGANPNVVVNWTGDAERLAFFGYSDSDPVLVVQLPDGSFVCNDDAGLNTVDPLVVIENPAEGAYQIHFGTAHAGQPALGFLGVTSIDMDDAMLADLDLRPMLTRRERPQPQPLPRLDPSTLLVSRPGIFGAVALQPGFEPISKFAAGGGDIPAFSFEDGQLTCAGFLSLIPSYTFSWTDDEATVRVFFEGREDSALAVITPDNQVLCNMDAAKGNLNPALDVPTSLVGRYKVYIASMTPDDVVVGRLTVTSDSEATPAILAPAAQ